MYVSVVTRLTTTPVSVSLNRNLSFPTLTVRLNGGTWSHL